MIGTRGEVDPAAKLPLMAKSLPGIVPMGSRGWEFRGLGFRD